MDSPYFDGCYFDPAYFDAAPCVVPPVSGGRQAFRAAKRRQSEMSLPEPLNDDEEAILILEGL